MFAPKKLLLLQLIGGTTRTKLTTLPPQERPPWGLSQEVCVDRAPARARERERERTRKYLDSGYVNVYEHEHEHVHVEGFIFHSLYYSVPPCATPISS